MNNYALPDDEEMVEDMNQFDNDVSEHYSDNIEEAEDQAQQKS